MMDMEYIRQRKIKHMRQYRIKVISTIVLGAILLVLCIAGIVKLISDSRAEGENPSQNEQEKDNNAGKNITPIAELTKTPPSTPAASPAPTDVPVPKIAIDAGHGGHDLGSTRDGEYEKDINLAIALEVERLLKELGYETFMIRSDDTFYELEDRPKLAVENGADLFVSVHQNALDNDTTTGGTEVWYNENNNSENVSLATTIVNAVTKRTSSKNRGVKVGNSLVVLKTLEIPACLVECGFISSVDERANLTDPDYQKKLAKGIVDGIQSYLPLPKAE